MKKTNCILFFYKFFLIKIYVDEDLWHIVLTQVLSSDNTSSIQNKQETIKTIRTRFGSFRVGKSSKRHFKMLHLEGTFAAKKVG